jgi:hypothetical protein
MTNVKRMWIGTTVFLWVVVILVPLYILPVCAPYLFDAAGKHHGCANTLYANTITGVLGLLITLAALREPFFKLSALFTALAGLMILLFPTVITGVCRVSTMPCIWGTKPGLIVAGIALISAGIAGLAIAKKSP